MAGQPTPPPNVPTSEIRVWQGLVKGNQWLISPQCLLTSHENELSTEVLSTVMDFELLFETLRRCSCCFRATSRTPCNDSLPTQQAQFWYQVDGTTIVAQSLKVGFFDRVHDWKQADWGWVYYINCIKALYSCKVVVILESSEYFYCRILER